MVGFGAWHAGNRKRRREKQPATCGSACSATTLWGWARGPRACGMGHRNRRRPCPGGRRGRGPRNSGTVGGRTRTTNGGSRPHRRLWGSRSRTLGSPPRGSPPSTGSPLSLGNPQSRGVTLAPGSDGACRPNHPLCCRCLPCARAAIHSIVVLCFRCCGCLSSLAVSFLLVCYACPCPS